MPAESLRSERDQAPLTIADDPVPASKTDDPVFGDQINEGENFEQSLSDVELIQANESSDRVKGDENDFWPAIRAEMRLNHHLSEKRVQQEIRWLQTHPEYWARLGPRMQRYLPYILSQIQEKGLPAELTLLPVVESALDPYAFSPYGASGLWQFMRPTAKQYGLRINDSYDGRRDVIDATDAALTFLQDLHKRFNDWQLALAAYNAGGGTVSKAIRKSQHRDFFRLRLPRETRAYVPRLLALSAIIAEPDAFGIELPAISNNNPLRVLRLTSIYDVAVVAETLDTTTADIYRFNPGLKRSQWSQDTPLRLILPESFPLSDDAEARASLLLESVPEDQRVAWQEIIVQSGDTISDLAQANGVTSRQLRLTNNLSTDVLQIGQSLRIPRQSLVNQPTVAGTYPYIVQRGDSLWSIAKRSNTSIDALARLNRIGRRDLLRVGQTIRMPTPHPTFTELGQGPSEIRKIRYKVRRGDSLSRIAKKFRVRVTDIVEWNAIVPERYLQPGQALTLFVDVIGG
jgi:membrane-bound lytic murein transglycosylase D